jgi:mRNA interferase RelE/StbE
LAYLIELKPVAKRQARRLPQPVKSAIDEAIKVLAVEPRPRGSKRVKGLPGGFRVRVGDYRVIYVVDVGGRVVYVLRIAWRDKAYKRLYDLRGD